MKDIFIQAAIAGILAGILGFICSFFLPLIEGFPILIGTSVFIGNFIGILIFKKLSE